MNYLQLSLNTMTKVMMWQKHCVSNIRVMKEGKGNGFDLDTMTQYKIKLQEMKQDLHDHLPSMMSTCHDS
jgi:hypothetical protein